MKGIIYWHPWIYKITLRILYGKDYLKRYKVIAKEVGNMEVLDLCCGDCKLACYIKNYRGIDFDSTFVKYVKRKGINVTKLDILKDNIPESECIVMQGSLYHFIPNHEKIIRSMLSKAKKVIICEPGINLAQSKNLVIALLAKKLTTTSRVHEYRFTKEQLLKLYKKFKAKKIIDIGRDMMGVFER